ncbi:MAG: tRNA 2-selenouridine(34) synthase MnmH [Polynucleobacter sp.]|nr:tRNA 2-selenouridine(34) synthase MnmH [Polynucleobacter sp.]
MTSLRLQNHQPILNASDLNQSLSQFDCIVDVRTPAEFELDHIPGAINLPVLENEERILIGTMYKQESPFAAKKLGAVLVAKNIARHIEQHFLNQAHEWRPLVYCWRGGERSGAFTHILQRIGWKPKQLLGGYQAFRRQVIADLEQWAKSCRFHVICGSTGSGKTFLLNTLFKKGAQVLDLEALAVHRGSVLGGLPDQSQPSQKAFETALWDQLRSFDLNRPIWVESESKKVGGLHIPDALMEMIRLGHCYEINASRTGRVGWLMHDYAHLLKNTTELNRLLGLLLSRHGKTQIEEWRTLAHEKQFAELVEGLLAKHYDPSYLGSIERNFANFKNRQCFNLNPINQAEFEILAETLIRESLARPAVIERVFS